MEGATCPLCYPLDLALRQQKIELEEPILRQSFASTTSGYHKQVRLPMNNFGM